MDVTELSREQIIELKRDYLVRLADEGCYSEVVGVEWDEPTYSELAAADEIVPDDVIFENYADTVFCEDDFSE